MDRLTFSILSSKTGTVVGSGDINFSEQDPTVIQAITGAFPATDFSEQDITVIRIIGGGSNIDFSEQDPTVIQV